MTCGTMYAPVISQLSTNLYPHILVSEEEPRTEVLLRHVLSVKYDELPYTREDDIFDRFCRHAFQVDDQNRGVAHSNRGTISVAVNSHLSIARNESCVRGTEGKPDDPVEEWSSARAGADVKFKPYVSVRDKITTKCLRARKSVSIRTFVEPRDPRDESDGHTGRLHLITDTKALA